MISEWAYMPYNVREGTGNKQKDLTWENGEEVAGRSLGGHQWRRNRWGRGGGCPPEVNEGGVVPPKI